MKAALAAVACGGLGLEAAFTGHYDVGFVLGVAGVAFGFYVLRRGGAR